jgi:hypothetical protein
LIFHKKITNAGRNSGRNVESLIYKEQKKGCGANGTRALTGQTVKEPVFRELSGTSILKGAFRIYEIIHSGKKYVGHTGDHQAD